MQTNYKILNPFARQLTHAVMILILVNGCVFFVQSIVDWRAQNLFTAVFGLNGRELLQGYIWQPVTYLFLHGSILHILFNMLALYFFGCEMEEVLGTKRFVKLYLLCGVVAAVGWVTVDFLRGGAAICVGASGAVLGMIGAFAAMFPKRMITLLVFFVLPITISARMMAILVGVVSVVMLVTSGGNVAHSAHLAGGLAGYIYGLKILSRSRLSDHVADTQEKGESTSGWLSTSGVQDGHEVVREAHDDLPTAEDIDCILEKISATGMKSLTRKERKILKNASGRKS